MTTRRNILPTTMLMLLVSLSVSAAIPEKPTQKLLVWDYAGIIEPYQVQLLEDSLEAFSRTTSNQIVVMTVTNEILEGYELAEFGQEVGQKWGVGHKGSDNGVIILIKPKTGDDAKGKGRIVFHSHYAPGRIQPRITHISDYHFKKDGTLVISPGFFTPWTLQNE